MKKLLLLLCVPLIFSCGNNLAQEITTEMLTNGYTGQGTYATSDICIYVGEFKNGEMHGQGTVTYIEGAGSFEGTKYVGEWKDDKMHGQGTFTNALGAKYVGEFKNDKKDGQGTYTWPEGRKYVGEVRDNKMHGKGTYTFPDGTIQKGLFENGAFIGR